MTQPIVHVGRYLKGLGIDVAEHPEFGGVSGVHAPGGMHYRDGGLAIDLRDWQPDHHPEYEGGPKVHWVERKKRLASRARQLGTFDEVFGPGDRGHDTHVHLGMGLSRPLLSTEQMEWMATGRWKRGDGGYSFEMPNSAAFNNAASSSVNTGLSNQLKGLGEKASGGGSSLSPVIREMLNELLNDLLGDGGNGSSTPALAEGGSVARAATPPLSAAAAPVAPAPTPAALEPAGRADDSWRQAAADPGRAIDPTSAAYWQQENMQQWAAANPKLAAPLLATAGVKLPASPAPAPAASRAVGEDFRPVDRGALSGVRLALLSRANAQPGGWG